MVDTAPELVESPPELAKATPDLVEAAPELVNAIPELVKAISGYSLVIGLHSSFNYTIVQTLAADNRSAGTLRAFNVVVFWRAASSRTRISFLISCITGSSTARPHRSRLSLVLPTLLSLTGQITSMNP